MSAEIPGKLTGEERVRLAGISGTLSALGDPKHADVLGGLLNDLVAHDDHEIVSRALARLGYVEATLELSRLSLPSNEKGE